MSKNHDELNKKVVKLDVVRRPLQSSRNSVSSGNIVPHEGCVATTADGKKYLIEKGVSPDGFDELKRIGGDQGSRIVKIGSKMPSGFVLVKSVPVKCDVTLNDLLEACGEDYSLAFSNCWNSTEAMKRVVSGDLQLPWQFKAGMTVGVIGIGVLGLLSVGLSRQTTQNRRH